jgi:hypothetical protein
MGIGGRIASNAVSVSVGAIHGATNRIQLASDGFGGLWAMLAEDDQSISTERFLVALVRAIRDDDRGEERSMRYVYARRRRLRLLSFGAGPVAGVATQLIGHRCLAAGNLG